MNCQNIPPLLRRGGERRKRKSSPVVRLGGAEMLVGGSCIDRKTPPEVCLGSEGQGGDLGKRVGRAW